MPLCLWADNTLNQTIRKRMLIAFFSVYSCRTLIRKAEPMKILFRLVTHVNMCKGALEEWFLKVLGPFVCFGALSFTVVPSIFLEISADTVLNNLTLIKNSLVNKNTKKTYCHSKVKTASLKQYFFYNSLYVSCVNMFHSSIWYFLH